MSGRKLPTAALMCSLFIPGIVSAEIIRGIDIDFVTIGNPGNVGDTRPEADPIGGGAVDYIYRIGKYEITNNQWNLFVAVSGAPAGNPESAYEQNSTWTGDYLPVNGVSWYEIAQFCNYLTSGDKSKGAYLFNGTNSNAGDFMGIDRESALSNYGIIYVIPTDDEWYKAAYFKPDGGGYSTYANGLETIPEPDNGWNYYRGPYVFTWNVGTGTMEQNGTYDMMGNIWEWCETRVSTDYSTRGGAWHHSVDNLQCLTSSYQSRCSPINEQDDIGFRIVSIPVNLLFNDNIDNAMAISLNAPTVGSSIEANGLDITVNGYNDNLDVWYKFEPYSTNKYTIKVTSSSFDTTVAVFDSFGKEIIFNDDFFGGGSTVILKATADKLYYIRVAGYDGQTGIFNILVTQQAVQAVQGDLNYDGLVNLVDFTIFAESWLIGL